MPSSGQQTAITTLETSMGYILLLVGATLLSYLSLKQQRDALACGGEVPNTFGLQLVADVIVVAALLYFYSLSLQQTDEAGSCSATFGRFSSFAVLAAAGVRLFNLVTQA